jgi:predicted nucleic acid-binding protein
MRIAVQDANILIDLDLSGTLGVWFELKIETHTTDLIIAQVERGGHGEVMANSKSGRLITHVSSAAFLLECTLWKEDKPDLEIQDASVFLLAKDLGALLLTGDKDLRSFSETERIKVHGTLWIFDQLVDSAALKPEDAADKLEHLLDTGRRLPKAECENRIATWRKVQ